MACVGAVTDGVGQCAVRSVRVINGQPLVVARTVDGVRVGVLDGAAVLVGVGDGVWVGVAVFVGVGDGV